jgi:FHS family Na+ dependent glucose MFS transporter 1
MIEAVAVRGRTLNLIGYYLAMLAVGLVAASLGPTLGNLAAQTNSDVNAISNLFIARPLGYLLGSFLFGRLHDRWPGHSLIVAASLSVAAALAVAPLLSSLWLLLALMVVLGVAEAGLEVGPNALLMWQYGEKSGPYLNGLHFCFGLGAFVAPLVVALNGGALTATYWTLAVLALPPALWLVTRPSPPLPAPVPASAERPGANVWLLALCFLFFLLYVGGEVGFGNWIYSYAVALGLTNKVTAAYLNSAFWGMLTVGRLLSIPLATRLRPRTVLALDLAGSALGAGLVLFANGPVMVWAGTLLTGLSMASVFPTLLNFAGRRVTLTARITGLFFVGGSLGAMLLPRLTGFLFEPVGPRVALVVVLSAVMGQALVYLVLRRVERR